MEKLILGIDDAGRGPVIGPMVLAGALFKEEDSKKLKDLGVKDSKMLTPQQREKLFPQIKKIASGWHAEEAFPNEIDSSLASGTNLNTLEAIKAAKIINKLVKDKRDVKVIIDCPSVNIPAWRATVLEYLENKDINLICEHKADINHVEVSAASILAKVTRDNEIKVIQKKVKEDMGSGYPSDPVTKEFLKHASKYKELGIVRESWATWQNHIGNKKQKSLGDF